MFLSVSFGLLLCFSSFYLSGWFILHLCIAYIAFICQSKLYWFIKKRNPSKPITSNSELTIPIRLQFELFFLNECPNGFVLLKSDVVGIRLKKLHPMGFGEMEDFPNCSDLVRWQ